jgi:hypothetical protein
LIIPVRPPHKPDDTADIGLDNLVSDRNREKMAELLIRAEALRAQLLAARNKATPRRAAKTRARKN